MVATIKYFLIFNGLTTPNQEHSIQDESGFTDSTRGGQNDSEIYMQKQLRVVSVPHFCF
jgi:hypothetical protein